MYFSEPLQNIAIFGMISLSVFFGDVLQNRIALYVASPLYEGFFRWRGRFRLERVYPLKEGRRSQRVWPNRTTWTLHHALRWVPRGTKMPYLAAVDLVAGLGASQT
ncbi:hypothetical protein M9H77_19276 [Catharanthus roseus]|uniref:Uncharacterized protein n=1 Tax=Catharanthus roseus TaxID=4058 RepID=A0ACC0B9X5_CATRO|nr:hypothetical protein M9H77_19276 [Catharanthus roseus]